MRSLLLLLAACGTPPAPSPPPPAPIQVPSEGLERDLERVQAFLATRPRYETPLGVGTRVPEAVGSLSAEACGSCHAEIYTEWKVSTHAAAWRDRQYQAEIGKSGNRWLCLNCHTPLLVQQDLWPVGLQGEDVELPVLVENPVFDAKLRDEGITCAACHVVDGAIHGPGLEGSTAPHPVVADARFRSEEVCVRCHQATATYPGKSFICVFDTGNEWKDGPWDERGKDCRSCHMPTVERPAATGGPVRTVARHGWRGAGIPKFEGVHPPPEANPPGLGLDARWEGAGVVVVATNANAGHMLPTGDPERWIQIDVRFLDAHGVAVGEPWSARIGQQWEWWPEPKRLADERLAPEASRTWTVPAPAEAATAVVDASSHRISAETADYHHLDGYPRELDTHHRVLPREAVSPPPGAPPAE